MHRHLGSCVSGALIGVLGVGCGLAKGGVGGDLFIRGVTWDGKVVDLDIATGAPTLRATGLFGANNLTIDAGGRLVYLANDGRSLVTLREDGSGAARIDQLDTAIEGRSLATAANGDLLAFGNVGAIRMWRIDPGALSVSGPVQLMIDGDTLPGLQAADTSPAGTLKGWGGSTFTESADGLLSVNAETGLVTDDFPGVHSGRALFQSMAYAPDGRLFGVTMFSDPDGPVPDYSLFEIDPATGTFDLIGGFGSEFDIRGIAVIPAPGGLPAVAPGLGLIAWRRRR